MANLIVITFDNMDDAAKLREAIRDLERPGLVELEDEAIVTKDADGKIEYHGKTGGATKVGAGAGGALGLLAAAMLPGVGLLAAGVAAGAGALIGRSVDKHMDKKFVNQVVASLQPNSSALFLLGKGDPKSFALVVEKFHGHVYSTTLSPELEAQLREALK